MDTTVWNSFSALRSVVNWIRYYVCIFPSPAFLMSLVTSYHFVEWVVVSDLTNYFDDSLLIPNGRSRILIISILDKVHRGLTAIFQAILIFISDSHFAGFKTLLFSTASYIIALTMLAFHESIPFSKRLVFNTIAIFYLAIGCGGQMTLRKFLSEQLRTKEPPTEPIEKRVKARTRLWYRAAWLIAAVVAVSVNFGNWTQYLGYSASAMAFSCLVFSCGIRFYRKEATSRKHDLETSTSTAKEISSSRQAMRECKSKSVIRFLLLPTRSFSIILGISVSTARTYFQQQAEPLEFPFDITSLLLLQSFSGRAISFLYDFILSKCQPADPETREMMTSWIKIWIGMLLMVACLLAGWRVEAYRHSSEYEEVNDIPYLFLRLALQYLLLGAAETFAEDGLNDLLDDRLPDSLKKYGPNLNGFATGALGNFLSIILLLIRKHWFHVDLERSRLDKYFMVVAILTFVNFSCSILWVFYKGMDGFAVEELIVNVKQPPAVEEPDVDLERPTAGANRG